MGNRFASSKQAISICDRCGFRFRLKELRELIVKTKKTNILACKSCWEPDHPQLQLGMYPVDDPQALRNPRPDSTYVQSGSNALGSRVTPFGLPVNTNTNDIVNPNDFGSGWALTNVTVYPYTGNPIVSANQISPNDISIWSADSGITSVSITYGPTPLPRAYNVAKGYGIYNGVYRYPIPLLYGTAVRVKFSVTVKYVTGSVALVGLLLETTESPQRRSIITYALTTNTLYSIQNTGLISFNSATITNNVIDSTWKDISLDVTISIPSSITLKIMPGDPSVSTGNTTAVYNPSLIFYGNSTYASAEWLTSPADTLADTIVPTTTNGLHYISQTFTQKTRYVMGVCAKPAGYNVIRIQNTDNTVGATFDISVGKISNVVGGPNIIPKAVYVGNGFWQCTILCTTTPSSELRIYVGNGATSYTGNGLNGVVLWGAWVSDGEEPYYGTGSDTWWINNTVQGA